MVGLNGLLPSIEGATLKALVDGIMNRNWQAEHPERAGVLGGHGGDTREQRAADALLELAGIGSFEAESATSPQRDATIDSDDPRRATNESGTDAGAEGGDADSGEAGDGAELRGPGQSKAVEATGPARRRPGPASAASAKPPKPTVVIVFDIDKYQAEMLGVGPVSVTPSLFDLARADLYYSFVNMQGEVLKFGRARRDPTPLQRIAVMARDRTCFYPGCTVPAPQCEVHHLNEWLLDNGFTDVEVLVASCKAHHSHVHFEALVAQRARDGTVTVRQRATGVVVAIASPERRPSAAA